MKIHSIDTNIVQQNTGLELNSYNKIVLTDLIPQQGLGISGQQCWEYWLINCNVAQHGKSKLAAQTVRNGRQALQRCLLLDFWVIQSFLLNKLYYSSPCSMRKVKDRGKNGGREKILTDIVATMLLPVDHLMAGLEKLRIRGIQDTRQFAFNQTNEAWPEAQRLDRTQSNVYLLQTTRQSLTKATAIRQSYLGVNSLNDNSWTNAS